MKLARDIKTQIRTALNCGSRIAAVAHRFGVDVSVVEKISRTLRRVDKMAAPDASPDEVVLGAGAGVDHWALRASVRAREKRLDADRRKHAEWLRSLGIEPASNPIIVPGPGQQTTTAPKTRARRVDGARHRLPNDMNCASPFSKRRFS